MSEQDSEETKDIDTCMVFGLADLFKGFDAGKFYGTFSHLAILIRHV